MYKVGKKDNHIVNKLILGSFQIILFILMPLKACEIRIAGP
jgi:hypothetical protein